MIIINAYLNGFALKNAKSRRAGTRFIPHAGIWPLLHEAGACGKQRAAAQSNAFSSSNQD
jgi:hypothetical protein